jgi:hypothetical protein
MNYGKTWGWITPRVFFNVPKSYYRSFYSYRFLRWWALCTRNVMFPAFCGCESIHGRKSTNVILSSHLPLSCWFHFVLISLHVPFILHLFPFICLSCSFHVLFIWHSCPFMFRRYLSNMQVFERWYVQTGQVGIRPNARVFIIFRYRFCYRVAIALEACAGCHFQGSWTCTCISSLSFYFTLIIFWAGKALVIFIYPLVI